MFLFYQISREYEFIYKRSIKEEIKFFQFLQEEDIKKMIVAKIWYKSQYATNYFGQPF